MKIFLSDYGSETEKMIKKNINKLNITSFSIKEVSFEVGYWRKANHIHKWFVNNVQDGEDDCGNYEVSYEQLIRLKEVCEIVLKDNDKAEELLPISSGFFFGGTEYGEEYFDYCKDTIEIINKIQKEEMVNKLGKDDNNFFFRSYEYSSSW